MLPFFNLAVESITVAPVIKPLQSQAAPAILPETSEKPSPARLLRKPGLISTPSIKGALSGNATENKVVEVVQSTGFSQYDETLFEPFNQEQLAERWKEFLDRMADRPSLCSALSNVPEITEGNKLLLRIGNSVQEEDIRLIKPELISWLRKVLKNAGIELTTRLERIESERMIYSDSEKLQMMMQKNPVLNELKQRFNLDFTE